MESYCFLCATYNVTECKSLKTKTTQNIFHQKILLKVWRTWRCVVISQSHSLPPSPSSPYLDLFPSHWSHCRTWHLTYAHAPLSDRPPKHTTHIYLTRVEMESIFINSFRSSSILRTEYMWKWNALSMWRCVRASGPFLILQLTDFWCLLRIFSFIYLSCFCLFLAIWSFFSWCIALLSSLDWWYVIFKSTCQTYRSIFIGM